MSIFEGQWIVSSTEGGGEQTLWSYTPHGGQALRCVSLQLTVPDNTLPVTIQREENDNEWKDVVTLEPGKSTFQSFWAQGVKLKTATAGGLKGRFKLEVHG